MHQRSIVRRNRRKRKKENFLARYSFSSLEFSPNIAGERTKERKKKREKEERKATNDRTSERSLCSRQRTNERTNERRKID